MNNSTKTKYICIERIKDVYEFVNKGLEVSGPIEVSRGNFCIDGKSLMGLISINPSEKFTVVYPKEDCSEFEHFISQFEC